jgi:hypothetical protein
MTPWRTAASNAVGWAVGVLMLTILVLFLGKLLLIWLALAILKMLVFG